MEQNRTEQITQEIKSLTDLAKETHDINIVDYAISAQIAFNNVLLEIRKTLSTGKITQVYDLIDSLSTYCLDAQDDLTEEEMSILDDMEVNCRKRGR